MQSGKDYRVSAPTGDEAVSIICYNLNTSPIHKEVKTFVSPKDYLVPKRTTGYFPADSILVFNWKKQTAEILATDKEMKLKGFTDCLFHLCPIRQGWGIIGIQEKYLSPAIRTATFPYQ